MKKIFLIWIAIVLVLPASAGASVFSTHLGWHSGDPWYDDGRPFYRSRYRSCYGSCYRPWYSGWPYPHRCRGPRGVPVEKQESILSELRRKDAQNRQARIEKTKRYNEIYKEAHGKYPVRQVIFSPNHPQAP